MDTYGDLVTLLLTFFVLLYAMSSMDASKWKAMASAFNTRATVVEETENSQDGDPAETEKITQVTEFNELYEYMNQYIQENGLSDTIKIYGGDGYAFIVFQNSVFF